MSEERTYEIAGRVLTEDEVLAMMERLSPNFLAVVCQRYPFLIDLAIKAKMARSEITPA